MSDIASSCTVVGAGAARGGVEAFRRLLSGLPADAPFALVLIQHRDPEQESGLAELLAPFVSMRVVTADDEQPIRPGTVYCVPDGREARLAEGKLTLGPKKRTCANPIDTLFASLARDGVAGCGVLLSGTETDGATGVRELRNAGRIAYVNRPEGGDRADASGTIEEAGTADFTGSPEEIAAQILALARGALAGEATSGSSTAAGDIAASPIDIKLADILDIRSLQALMDDFYQLAHVPMSVIDLAGNVLVGVGWQDVCMQFHRVHPETCAHCVESDTELSTKVPPGEMKLYRCKNGMWDMVTPVMLGGEHVGNVFSGQFFFDDEPIDYEFFRAQARRYDFDEDDYLAAIDAVPRLSRATVDTGTAFLTKLAGLLSRMSYTNSKLARSLVERDLLTESIRHSQEDLNRAQTVARTGSWRLNTRANQLQWSDETYRLFGIPVGTPLTYEAFLAAVHPDDRALVDARWQAALRGEPYDLEHRVVTPDGVLWVRELAEMEFDEQNELLGGFGTVRDITSEKEAQAERTRLFEAEVEARRQADKELKRSETLRRAIAALTSSIELKEVLETLAGLIVESTNASRAVVLLAGRDERMLEVAVVKGFSADQIAPTWRIDQLPQKMQQVVRNRTSATVDYESVEVPEGVRAEASLVGARLVLWTPVVWKGELLGLVGVDVVGERRRFSTREVDLIDTICGNAAAAIANARLYETEHSVADRLQEALLTLPSRIDGIEYAASYRTATAGARVGGDFFDLFPLGDGRVGITIGDVSGKGLAAAAFTSVARNVIRAHAVEGDPPEVVIAKANSMVYHFTQPDVFFTAFFGILDTATGELSYCSGGHPEAIVTGTRDAASLAGRNPIIGAYGDLAYAAGYAVLEQEDTLILYTDGVTEARSAGEMYGQARLLEIIAHNAGRSVDDLVEAIISDVLSFSEGRLRDDTAIVAVRRQAPTP